VISPGLVDAQAAAIAEHRNDVRCLDHRQPKTVPSRKTLQLDSFSWRKGKFPHPGDDSLPPSRPRWPKQLDVPLACLCSNDESITRLHALHTTAELPNDIRTGDEPRSEKNASKILRTYAIVDVGESVQICNDTRDAPKLTDRQIRAEPRPNNSKVRTSKESEKRTHTSQKKKIPLNAASVAKNILMLHGCDHGEPPVRG
jgi:hypothetical protein